MVAAGVSLGQALLVEFVLTFLLVTVVWGTLVDERAPRLGGFGVGLVVFAAILVGGPLTGAAMNPARWFGPALVFGDLSGAVVYIVGPIVGATLAALSVRYLVAER